MKLLLLRTDDKDEWLGGEWTVMSCVISACDGNGFVRGGSQEAGFGAPEAGGGSATANSAGNCHMVRICEVGGTRPLSIPCDCMTKSKMATPGWMLESQTKCNSRCKVGLMTVR
jgi:hypothetical protein